MSKTYPKPDTSDLTDREEWVAIINDILAETRPAEYGQRMEDLISSLDVDELYADELYHWDYQAVANHLNWKYPTS